MRHYICSPLSADTRKEVEKNMENAKLYMRMVDGIFCQENQAITPHAWLPDYCDDRIPEERKVAMDVCMTILDACEDLVVCGSVISNGMKQEIERAKSNSQEIFGMFYLTLVEDDFYAIPVDLADINMSDDVVKKVGVRIPHENEPMKDISTGTMESFNPHIFYQSMSSLPVRFTHLALMPVTFVVEVIKNEDN